MEQQRADQEMQLTNFVVVSGPSVLRLTSSDESSAHLVCVLLRLEVNPIDATPRPAAVQVQDVLFPVDEPLVLHHVRNEATANTGVLGSREDRVEGDGLHWSRGPALPRVPCGDLL